MMIFSLTLFAPRPDLMNIWTNATCATSSPSRGSTQCLLTFGLLNTLYIYYSRLLTSRFHGSVQVMLVAGNETIEITGTGW